MDRPPVSAITWACGDGGVNAVTWIRHPPGAYEINGVTVQLTTLFPQLAYFVPWDKPAQPGTHSVSVLRVLSALAKQPLPREDSPKIHETVRSIARHAKIRPESFRRIALRRPETASHEIAAARQQRRAARPLGTGCEGTGASSITPASMNTGRYGSRALLAATSPSSVNGHSVLPGCEVRGDA